jgi:hypothetical protein
MINKVWSELMFGVPKIEKMNFYLLINSLSTLGTLGTLDTLGTLGTLGTYLSKYDKQKTSCLHK